MTIILVTAGLLAACSATESRRESGPTKNAGLPFAEFGSIRDWRSDGTRGIYIESQNAKWYYATFLSPCIQLPFAEAIGFKTTPPLPLDKFDSIIVRGEQCDFVTFDEVPGPPQPNPHNSLAPPTK